MNEQNCADWHFIDFDGVIILEHGLGVRAKNLANLKCCLIGKFKLKQCQELFKYFCLSYVTIEKIVFEY